MSQYLRTLFRALKGEWLCSFESLALTTRHSNAITEQLDQARKVRGILESHLNECRAAYHNAIAQRDETRKERDEIRTRYESLVAECTRHRHATWEITHK